MNTSFVIKTDDDGIRLDRWFKRQRPDVPHALLQKLLRKGDIRVDGKKAETSTRIASGQTVTIREESVPKVQERKEKIAYKVTEVDRELMQSIILFEDDDMFVLNKPSGLAVQGGTGQTKSLDEMLFALGSASLGKPKLVHRLDQDTSGALIVAKSSKSAAHLAKLIRERQITKLYWALVIGFPLPTEGMIDMPMAKQERGKDSRMENVEIDEDAGKPAKSRYKVIEELGGRYAWMELEPVTGRTHQLRVHMAAIGHPIVSDGKYGGKEAFIGGSMNISGKLHLHARSIELPGMPKIEAPLPPHMKKTWGVLGLEE